MSRTAQKPSRSRVKPRQLLADDPLWYKDAIFYELRVRSFFDASGDGIGDFPGLTQKLDYLEDLGVTTLWLLPFYPSPMRDDGYDIADYTEVNPDLGTLDDFKTFLDEAHRRKLRVVTELVINHTSDQHPWFQRARRAKPGSRERDFYVWSDTVERYQDARIIFKDFERSNWTWDPVANAYYWHRFYAHQPDLNFDSPDVKKALFRALDFWLELGVDGLRLDAIPYLFERNGTSCENLPETYEFVRELRRHVDRKFKNRMLLAEANQWPDDAAAYIGEKACHMAFHFPIMPRLYMALHTEERFPIVDVLAQTPELDASSQWALFLRNHDELTLEMVTEEERDTMYRAFALDTRMRVNLGIRRRLAPLVGSNRRALELLNGLLLSLPGTPVLYYGDEIGMGDNVYLGDRDGVRTPMQWSSDRNAGFSRANPQRLVLPIVIDPEYHYEALNVEAQEQNRHSLLWWMRHIIALRKRFKAFGRGAIEFLHPSNPRVLVFLRTFENEKLLVVANLSRFTQYVDLDLSRHKGLVPRELFGHTAFPRIGDAPYILTLGPHSFYWFSLEAADAAVVEAGEQPMAVIESSSPWRGVPPDDARPALDAALLGFVRRQRWFASKARGAESATLVEVVASPGSAPACLGIVQVELGDGEAERYFVPLLLLTGERAYALRTRQPNAVVAEVRAPGLDGGTHGLLVDALAEPAFLTELMRLFDRRRPLRSPGGEIVPVTTTRYGKMRGPVDAPIEPRVLDVEQSNTSVVFGDRFMLKVLRKLDDGPSPEAEMTHYLTARGYEHTPPLAAHLEHRKGRQRAVTLAVLTGYVPNQGDAWRQAREELKRYYEGAMTDKSLSPGVPGGDIVGLLDQAPPEAVAGLMGPYLHVAALLGRRVAEMHLALATPTEDPDFAPEPYPMAFQHAIYQSMRNLAGKNLRLLRSNLGQLPEPLRPRVQHLLGREGQVLERFAAFLKRKMSIIRMRCHGDLHLGQVLHAGNDFTIVDFEGEPARTLEERRRKRSALRDVAGMLRSFHYAAHGLLKDQIDRGTTAEKDRERLEAWADAWYAWSSAAFLRQYLETVGKAPFVPRDRGELRVLLDAFLLEKAVYELGYELNNRPSWLPIPMRGIEQILDAEPAHA